MYKCSKWRIFGGLRIEREVSVSPMFIGGDEGIEVLAS
jgi:hypothetical protein